MKQHRNRFKKKHKIYIRPRKKKFDVSRPDFFQKGGGRFLLFTIFTIFTISYLLVYYESQATITFTEAADTHSTCYNCMCKPSYK